MKNTFYSLGPMPKVGIRLVIDARLGGIRESLESTTMGMAKRAAHLISTHLKYFTGEQAECVIADTAIGRAPEAKRVYGGVRSEAFVQIKMV